MCHVLGVDTPKARVPAAHLGMGMQLSNIARDVAEDWDRGRLYLPEELLAAHGAPGLAKHLGGSFPRDQGEAVGRAVVALLREADRFYRSGDTGMVHLSWRSRLSVRTARWVYAAIGDRLVRRHGDVLSGRVFVPKWQKVWYPDPGVCRGRVGAATGFKLSGRPPRRCPELPPGHRSALSPWTCVRDPRRPASRLGFRRRCASQ